MLLLLVLASPGAASASLVPFSPSAGRPPGEPFDPTQSELYQAYQAWKLPSPLPWPAASGVGGGARFFRLALNGTQVTPLATSALRDSLIILAGEWRWRERDQIKAANPGVKVLMYLNLTRAANDDAFGNHATCLRLDEAQANGWYSGYTEPTWGGHVLNLGPGYGERCLLRAKEALARHPGWDGVMLDDLNVNASGAPIDDATWRSRLEAVNRIVGPGLRAAGYLAIPNMSGSTGSEDVNSGGWLARQFDYYSGGLDEWFTRWSPGTAYQPDAYITRAFEIAERMGRQGKYYLASTPGDESAMQFALCLQLLVTSGGAMSFNGGGDGAYGTELYYPLYDRAKALGRPLGPRVGGRRDFEHGYVTADIPTKQSSIVLVP